MDFKKGITYVGLCDVVGGRMWYCVSPGKKEGAYFWRKKECEKFVRGSFSGSDRKYLLSKLRECKGRAKSYL